MTFRGRAVSQKLAGGLTFFVRKNWAYRVRLEMAGRLGVDFNRRSFPFCP